MVMLLAGSLLSDLLVSSWYSFFRHSQLKELRAIEAAGVKGGILDV